MRARQIASALFLGGLVTLVSSSSAFAQSNDSGAITGYVFDQTGMPIKGVKVVARSDGQIGGPKTAYSNDEGFFRMPQLQPGIFEIDASAPKLQSQKMRNIKVGINTATELQILMEVQTEVEEVKIVEKAPVISTTQANIKEVYDLDFVDMIPHGSRDGIFSSMVGNTAGAVGNRVRGGAGNQTIITMDGFNMQGQYPTLKTMGAFDIQSGGYGPENAMASGAAVNLVTRSGSNKYEVELTATAENRQSEFFTDGTDTKLARHHYVVNPTVSGPIIKDRLWFFVNMEIWSERNARGEDPQGYFPTPPSQLKNWHKGTAKLTWQMTARNKLTFVGSWDDVYEWNRRPNHGVDPLAQEHRRGQRFFAGLIWESLLTDSLLFRSQVGAITVPQHIFPALCDSNPDCDSIPGQTNLFPRQQWWGNNGQHQRNDLYTFQFINRLEYFVNSKALGEHNLQLRQNYNLENEIQRRSVPGDRFTQYNPNPQQQTTYYSNDPRIENERFGWWIAASTAWRNNLSLSDQWRPTRFLTLNPGVAWITAAGSNSNGDSVVSNDAWSPSISAAWDATHDGRTVVRGSFNSYVDVDINGLARHTLGSQVNKRCQYNASASATASMNAGRTVEIYDSNCEFSGGASKNTFGLPCGPTGVDVRGNPCREKLKIPRTWEYTLGAEREIIQGLALGGDFIYRKFTNQWENRETNRIWVNSGEVLDPTGGYRNGRSETITDLGTPDSAWRRYVGVTGSVTKREGRFRIRASYTWSRLDGTVFNGRGNRFLDIPPRDIYLEGPGPDDHRHEIRMMGTYQLAKWAGIGFRYNYNSGMPFNRLYQNVQTGNFESYRARQGYNPGGNLNDPADDRPARKPDVQEFSAQFRLNFQPLIGYRLETWVDVINLLAMRTPTGIGEADGRDYATFTGGRQGPFKARLGLMFRY